MDGLSKTLNTLNNNTTTTTTNNNKFQAKNRNGAF
jgi:hypothetical protein